MNTETIQKPNLPLADVIGSAALGRIVIVEYSLIQNAAELESRAKGLRNLANDLMAIREKALNTELRHGAKTPNHEH